MNQPMRLSDLAAGRAPTFEQPFEMMTACHERLQRMLGLLGKLVGHLEQHGADEQARDAARDVMRYFDKAAPQHHRDEELHVFPPLLAQGEPATVAVVNRLRADHVRMEEQWTAARAVLAAIAAGELASVTAGQQASLDAFAALYADHLVAEEDIAYPAARALLGEPALAAMGREMQARRDAA
jgi:hemerythrin-like domain-containing protein